MIKISDLIQKLQQFQAEHSDHPDLVISVEAYNEGIDGRWESHIGNDFVRIEFQHDEGEQAYGHLVTETKTSYKSETYKPMEKWEQ